MRVSNFFAATDIVVIGSDPEMADISNPRGEIHGFASFVYADSERGDRKSVFVKTAGSEADAMAPAEKMAAALNVRLANGKLPTGFDRWQDARPAYGSKAYMEYGQEDDLMLERREAEEEGWR